MSPKLSKDKMVQVLESFLRDYQKYDWKIRQYGKGSAVNEVEELGGLLRRQEPLVTHILNQVLGEQVLTVGTGTEQTKQSTGDLLGNALIGGGHANSSWYGMYAPLVIRLLDGAIGTIQAGLPTREPQPELGIRDSDLDSACKHLLSAGKNYDTVIREATTVLEHRIRRKAGHDLLSMVIPASADQMGINLVNKLFKPGDPVLVISSDRSRQVALHTMLSGVFLYLRNDYHHRLDRATKLSWAWATVGLIDRLLAEVDSCTVNPPQ